ncbi:MAG TPA: DUF3396 domain-containing protein [Archangium sp.]|uniref:DUF3396 domain-containing protein n=1 Tax=Archangium sp. TaxID=1872627 RepID=UPI002E2F09AC|nr:DUF3396 domain-containing protein [Archangium sp.]HEX5746165.1 DUF3396 domain-containing protein [Archangium sp.]
MSSHYPRIRICAPNGHLLVREGLSLCFYIRRAHQEIARAVLTSLDTYLHAIEPETLGWYVDVDGEEQALDDAGWKHIRRELTEGTWPNIQLAQASGEPQRYDFDYFGKPLGDPRLEDDPDASSALSISLPTEYLEEHGPGHVRELALKLAAPLPFHFGQVGLAFNGQLDLIGISRQIRARCFRYPGMDIPDTSWHSWKLGFRVRGPSWLTFLGQPILGELGGASGLRSRLSSPGTTVQELEGERAVVTLGPWPEAGDTEQGQTLPAYRELARVLEPWLYHERFPEPWPYPEQSNWEPDFSPEDNRRWERRFLD